MSKIKYPITLNYVQNWGEWEIARELYANALDASRDATMRTNGNALIIENAGAFELSALLLGESIKPNEGAIGQFGEGMKLAILAATRLGKRVSIRTGDMHITNTTEELAGKSVLVLNVKEAGWTDRTVVKVSPWDSEDYKDRFISRDEDKPDDRVLVTGEAGDILEGEGDIYIKGVFVMHSDRYGFSYNLKRSGLNRDRNVVSGDDVLHNISAIWIDMPDADYLSRMLLAAEHGKEEKDIYIFTNTITDNPDRAKVWREAYVKAFGDGVIWTNEDSAREASYRGAKVIHLEKSGYYLANIGKALLGKDTDYIAEQENRAKGPVYERKMSITAKFNLKLLRKLAARAECEDIPILPYTLPHDVAAEFDHGNREVHIRVDILEDLPASVNALIHELGHGHGAADCTAAHTNSCNDIAAKILVTYMTHGY